MSSWDHRDTEFSRKYKELKKNCVELRKEKRMSFDEILAIHNVARSTLSIWLRPYPLTQAEQRKRRKRRIYQTKDRGAVSKYWNVVDRKNLSRLQKGKIAEAAILFRLVLHGFIPYGSVFDGDKVDWFVEVPATGKTWKIQVRWAKRSTNGLPHVSLKCMDGHARQRRFRSDEFDFIVGYELYNDTAYVFSYEEVEHLAHRVSVREEAAEAWDKLRV